MGHYLKTELFIEMPERNYQVNFIHKKTNMQTHHTHTLTYLSRHEPRKVDFNLQFAIKQ